MIRRSLLLIFWIVIVTILLLFSLVFKDTTTAIVAQVEPMKSAISYHKAIKIVEIFVIPGQMVKPGDVLVKVERPDLVLDVEKKENDIARLAIDRSVTESKYVEKKQQLIMDKDSRLRNINGQIDQLKLIVENNQQLSNQFGNLTGFADTVQRYGKSYYEIEMEVLEKEKDFIIRQYEIERNASKMIYEKEIDYFTLLESQHLKELEVLLDEEQQLIKTSEIHGTVGTVNAQPGELLSPYSTILSIYESNPTIIKAVMNEGYQYEIEVGSNVLVESTNRSYNIEGKIIEIGARIIEYPGRLKSNQNMPMYGQEVFIKIPEGNKFLNGERVFVNINN